MSQVGWRLRQYAQKLSYSVKRFFEVIWENFLNILRFLKNLILLPFITAFRGLQILWKDIINFIKSTVRVIFEIIRWPFEKILLPITKWLAESTSKLLYKIENHDGVAVISFVVLVIACSIGMFFLYSFSGSALNDLFSYLGNWVDFIKSLF